MRELVLSIYVDGIDDFELSLDGNGVAFICTGCLSNGRRFGDEINLITNVPDKIIHYYSDRIKEITGKSISKKNLDFLKESVRDASVRRELDKVINDPNFTIGVQ